MVQGKHKSRTMRRIFTKTPGGKVVSHFKLRKPGFARCQATGVKLQGVARARPSDLKKITRSSRTPNRPYGGVLCSKAARAKIIALARDHNE